MGFQKKYVEEDKWMDIAEDVFYLDMQDYYKDPVKVGIGLIAESPDARARTNWAFYRFVGDEGG